MKYLYLEKETIMWVLDESWTFEMSLGQLDSLHMGVYTIHMANWDLVGPREGFSHGKETICL